MPGRTDPNADVGQPTAADFPVAVPDRWRRPIRWIARRWIGRVLLRTATGLIDLQVFDRAMTLAAQAFTSIFPILILAGVVLGSGQVQAIADAAHLPEASQRLINDALGDRGLSTFGVFGALVVLLSSTGLARALARAYGAVWTVRAGPAGPRAAWRWLLTVVLLAGYMVGTRVVGGVMEGWPRHELWSAVVLLLADGAVAVFVPHLLLGQAVPLRLLIPGGCAFALAMLVLRPAGAVYLPRALQTAQDRYGTIGLAFTYIGWLYVLAFCLLVTAVLGYVVARDDGVLGRVVRGR
ncbi:MAG TPA: YhjD/YihY/BrkB family envelope integrity protein [Actinoplanes sp.]|nr:YhjD/YihY/BrkB family envelope integrity protein [Actinoplanes sp.]